jgi:lysine-specific histone demethylase 1B
MDRKEFIKHSGMISLGLLLPSTVWSSCRRDSLLDESTYDGKVLIIGAGAAGLYAGYILKSRGIAFQILEAGDRIGGRLAKLEGFADDPLDLGAQWLHGKNSIVGDLIAKTKTPITLDNSELTFWYQGNRVSSLPKDIEIFEGDNKPDISYQAYAQQQGFGDEYTHIVEAIAGDQGAAASRLSVYYNNLEEEEWNSGDQDYKFRNTFFDLINTHIASEIQDSIVLNAPIHRVEYSQSGVVVTGFDGQQYAGDKVIITAPISILKRNDIQFIPALPVAKTTAFSKIGMDAGMKVFLKFSDSFFDANIIGGSICAAYADERVGKSSSEPILLAFVMGEQAEYLTSLGTDTAIVAALLQELDSMYSGRASATFVKAHLENWTLHPYIRGAYSYSTVGMGDARKVAAQPIDNTLYFAGEAMNINGHHQTVHGAVETGYIAVMQILETLKK